MTRKLTRNSSFSLVASFVVLLTLLIAGAALAQVTGAGQVSGSVGLGDQSTNSGSPLFVPAVAYDSGGYTATSVVVGDINGDGKLDLVVGNRCADSGCQSGHGSVGVMLGNGDGTFRSAIAYDSGGAPNPFFDEGVVIADLNGDHKPDIVVANACGDFSCSYDGTVGVLLGNGDGTFQPVVIYRSGGSDPGSVVVADVDGDGRSDLLVTNACGDANCDGTVGVLLGNGNGTFKAAMIYSSGGALPKSMVVADVNHDGKPDLIVANLQSHDVGVLLGNGNGTFQTAISYDSGGGQANSVAVADVNGDGTIDLLVCNAQDTVGVLLGNGDGTFQPAVTYSSDPPGSKPGGAVALAVADANGDGKPDLLVVNSSLAGDANNGGAVAVLLGNGNGTFQSAVNYASGGYQALGLAVGDVNGDGTEDVLIANSCSANSLACGGPVNETRGVVGVLLNNTGPHVPTTTSLVSSMNPTPINQVVIYTATVANQSGGSLVGTVAFKHGGATTTVPLAGNQATYQTSYSASGVYSITSAYSGDASDFSSTSATLREYVGLAPTKTLLTTSGSPSHVGQPVTFTATVAWTYGAVPNGELVTFFDGIATIGTGATSSGIASLTTSSLSVNTHSIRATYVGDASFKPSSGSVKQVVEKYATTMALKSSLNPSAYNQAVTFTARVRSAGPTPTGKVVFMDETLALGSVTLSGGVAKLTESTLAVGTHPITAQYLGDAVSGKSMSPVLNQVVK
ncbi:MAG TPA: FG-GAP-like repeat-containing protein [Terriglobales bacterium]|nr:FG-GAP-like repeat-containing protein [Terriglobales bacterium]